MRNYIYELKTLGQSYKHISEKLGLPSRTISAIAHGDKRLPVALYEKTRNYHRTVVSKKLQSEGFHGLFRKAHERSSIHQIYQSVTKLQTITDNTYKQWNRSYISYKRNPAEWKKRHPYQYYKSKNDKYARWHTPHEISRAEIKKRISIGASRVYELDSCVNDSGNFVSPPIDEGIDE